MNTTPPTQPEESLTELPAGWTPGDEATGNPSEISPSSQYCEPVDAPARKTTNSNYGVYRLKTTGTSYRYYTNCSTTPKSTVTSYAPYKNGWYLWES
ncbi:hypothetical protein [Streptomyces sp. NPDC051569]|uniref:hypothetical protein n=1 Tax=Streptomyces sp. NPDC051569 TaxID=3365661 RepID=UPI003792E53F